MLTSKDFGKPMIFHKNGKKQVQLKTTKIKQKKNNEEVGFVATLHIPCKDHTQRKHIVGQF